MRLKTSGLRLCLLLVAFGYVGCATHSTVYPDPFEPPHSVSKSLSRACEPHESSAICPKLEFKKSLLAIVDLEEQITRLQIETRRQKALIGVDLKVERGRRLAAEVERDRWYRSPIIWTLVAGTAFGIGMGLGSLR